jgi:hypothetical protein
MIMSFCADEKNPHSYTGSRQLARPEKGSHAQRFLSLQELQQRLLAFQSHYERSALPLQLDLHPPRSPCPSGQNCRHTTLPQPDGIRHRNFEREYSATSGGRAIMGSFSNASPPRPKRAHLLHRLAPKPCGGIRNPWPLRRSFRQISST